MPSSIMKVKILTGARRVLMVLKTTVPCKLGIGENEYRVYHWGRTQTCYHCEIENCTEFIGFSSELCGWKSCPVSFFLPNYTKSVKLLT